MRNNGGRVRFHALTWRPGSEQDSGHEATTDLRIYLQISKALCSPWAPAGSGAGCGVSRLLQQLDVVEHREVQAYDDASDACAHEHDDQRLEYRCQAVDGRAHLVVVESRDFVEHVVERT